MRCPFCKRDNDRVVDSRSAAEGASIRRRRECLACGRRYTTYEQIEQIPIQVVKKGGSRVTFDPAKILAGLLKACEKRPVPLETLEELVHRVEMRAREEFDREVPSRFIGEEVMRELRLLDQVGYVRFASVYREFQDVTEFIDELAPILRDAGVDRGRPATSRQPVEDRER